MDKKDNDQTLIATDEQQAAAQQQAARLEDVFNKTQREQHAKIHQRIGRKQALEMIEKFANVSSILDLQRIKETKEYKGLEVISDGKLLTVNTWDEYCVHVEGRSRQAIDLDLQNLNILGESMFDSMRQVGIGPGKMRSIRKLPEDELLLIQQASESDDKDQVVELIDNLVTKHAKEKAELAKEKEQLTAERDEALADAEATREVSAGKDQKINQLATDLEKNRRRLSAQEPDEVAKELQIEAAGIAAEFKSLVMAKLRPAVEQLMDYQALHPEIDQQNWLAGTIADLQLDLSNICDDFQLDELQPGQMPDWLDPDKVAAVNEKVGRARDEKGI